MSMSAGPDSSAELLASLEGVLDAPISEAMRMLSVRPDVPQGGVRSVRALLTRSRPPNDLLKVVIDATQEAGLGGPPARVVQVLHRAAIAVAVVHRQIRVRDDGPVREAMQQALEYDWLTADLRQVFEDALSFLSDHRSGTAGAVADPSMKQCLDEITSGKPNAPGRGRRKNVRLPSWLSSPAMRQGLAVAVLVLGCIPLASNLMSSEEVYPEYEGYHDPPRGALVTGWAWDKNAPNKPIEVTIEDGTNGVVRILADQERPDIMDKGNGRHGFRYEIPKAQRDGRTRKVWVKIAGTRRILDETPRTQVYYR